MADKHSYQDRGWAWMVVVGAFISHFLTCGFEKGYSVLYAEIMEEYGTTAALAAGLGGFSASVRLLMAPLSVVLCNRFSEQKVVIFGGLLCFIGLLITTAGDYFYVIAIGYGVIFGFGLTLVYTPSLIVCTAYFLKRRATAVSLSLSGCGFAALTVPYLIVYLLEEFAYPGTMLILAAISLHYCVSGALYRDPGLAVSIGETQRKSLAEEQLANGHATSELSASRCAGCRSWLRRKLSLQVYSEALADPWLSLFIVAFCFNMMGSGPVTTILIHYAERLGVPRKSSVQLLAIEGSVQVVVRVFCGLAFDHRLIKPHRGLVWSLNIALSSLVILSVAFVTSIHALSALMFFRGVFLAIYISQQAVITADVCEDEVHILKHIIGLTQIGKGVGVLIGSWLAGTIKDYTDDYRTAFIFLSFMQFLGALMAGTSVVCSRRRRSGLNCAGKRPTQELHGHYITLAESEPGTEIGSVTGLDQQEEGEKVIHRTKPSSMHEFDVEQGSPAGRDTKVYGQK